MRRRLEQLFRPVYRGGPMEVRPKHWWSPKERRSAKLAARILEHKSDELAAQAMRRAAEIMRSGIERVEP